MDKLKECAIAFQNLFDIQYKIVLGKKCRLTEFTLGFNKKEFMHLIGLHKLKDIMSLKIDRGDIFDLIIDEKITYEMISQSAYFYEDIKRKVLGIEKRIEPFIHIEEFLNSNEIMFKYSHKINPTSDIRAEFLLVNTYIENKIYIFSDNDLETSVRFCRSFFPKYSYDYESGQMNMKLLFKEKVNIKTGETVVQYDKLTCKEK